MGSGTVEFSMSIGISKDMQWALNKEVEAPGITPMIPPTPGTYRDIANKYMHEGKNNSCSHQPSVIEDSSSFFDSSLLINMKLRNTTKAPIQYNGAEY